MPAGVSGAQIWTEEGQMELFVEANKIEILFITDISRFG